MECKKCGAVAPENATFCPSCGERVDGKKVCARCGKANEEQYKFCVYCGERIDGKAACKNCGAEYEGEYCPQCGVKSGKTQPRRSGDVTVHKGGAYARVMNIVSVSLGLAAALAAFVFMFFINFEGERSIFYYFKDSFQELKEVKDVVKGGYYSGAVMALMYMDVITTCVIAGGTLASVATFFTLTTVYSVLALCGKKKGSPVKTAIYTAFCYILGGALLYPFGAGELVGVKIGFNGATVAGLVVCSVALAGATVCVILSDLKKFQNKSFVVRWICTGACVIMGLVAFLLVRDTGMEFLVSDMSVAEGSPGVAGATVLGFLMELYPTKTILKDEMWAISIFSMVATVFVLAAIVFALMALFRNIRNSVEKKNGNGMLWSILSFVCAIGAMVFTILIAKQTIFIIDTTSGMGNIKMKITSAILATVFAFVNMGIAIAAKIVSVKHKETDNE